jgi:hypothetical protein
MLIGSRGLGRDDPPGLRPGDCRVSASISDVGTSSHSLPTRLRVRVWRFVPLRSLRVCTMHFCSVGEEIDCRLSVAGRDRPRLDLEVATGPAAATSPRV